MSHAAAWEAFGAGLIGALWLAAAGWAVAIGLRRQGEASAQLHRLARLDALAKASPALPLLIDAAGRLEGSQRLARWFGRPLLPATLGELGELEPADLQALERAVALARSAAQPFTLRLSLTGSDRRLRLVGAPAPPDLHAPGSVLVWVFDATESGRAILSLSGEVAALRDSLEALAALIEAAPIPMWLRGPDLRLTLVNSAYVRAVEAGNAGEVVARALELIEASGETSPLASAAAARAENRVYARSAPATVAGERRMLQIVDVPLGEIGVAGYAVDVEELERARADLQRFADAQRDLLDHLSAGVAQFGADHSLSFFNQPFARLFGLELDWLGEHPEFDRVLERIREAGRLPESRDFPSWKAERRAWFTAPAQPIEETWLLPGGSHLRVVAQPLPDGGLLLIFEDRTEQLRLSSARDTLLRVRTATFDNLFEAVGVFAADGRLSIWNNRFRELWDIDEQVLAQHPRVDALVDAVARKLSNPARASVIRDLVRIATVERQQRSGRVQLTDGRHFDFTAVPLPDGNALFTMLDVTDSRRVETALREANSALEEADKIKTAFVAGMSYELRTPLTSIAGFAEMLAGGYAGDLSAAQSEYVGAITQSVETLGKLIDGVLDITQSEAGMLPGARESVRVADLVRRAAEAVDRQAIGAGIVIGLRVDPLAGMIEGDAARLEAALGHVIGHAIGRTEPGGRIEVSASGTSEIADLIVRDEGPPIEPGEQARLVTRFPNFGPGASDEARGIATARRMAELHRGTLTISSGEAGGATVTLKLPRVQPDG